MGENKHITIDITTGSVIRAALFAVLLFGLYYLRDVVMIVLFSVVLASAIEPAVTRLEKMRIPRVVALIFIYLAVFSVFAFLFYLIVPTFLNEFAVFSEELPVYFSNPNSWQTLFGMVPDFPDSVSSALTEVFQDLQNQLSEIASGFFQATSKIFGGAMSLVLIVVLSFYLAVQKNGLENFIRVVAPVQYEDYILNLWRRSSKKIGLWLQGQIVLGLLVGVLVFLGLTILRVKYALTFALLAAVFEIFPIFGPILASIPPVAVAFLQNPTLGLAVVVLYIVIQQFENHLIYPLVVRKIVGIPAIMAILALIVGAKLGGFFGLLLSVPVATTIKEFLDDVVAKKQVSVKPDGK